MELNYAKEEFISIDKSNVLGNCILKGLYWSRRYHNKSRRERKRIRIFAQIDFPDN